MSASTTIGMGAAPPRYGEGQTIEEGFPDEEIGRRFLEGFPHSYNTTTWKRRRKRSIIINRGTTTILLKCFLSFAFWVVASTSAYTTPTNGVCGKCGTNNRNGSYITLQTAAAPGEIPWQVGLETRHPVINPFNFIFGPKFATKMFCAGTLINANWVLTARHCTRGKNARSIWAHLGKVNRRSYNEGLVIQIDGKAEYPGYPSRHPSYLESDVALLRLKHGIDLTKSPTINSICWPTVTPSIGQQVIATGWGIKFHGFGQYGKSKLLQKASLSLISDTSCRMHSAPVRNAVLCAWGINANTCDGDSGGPLIGWNNGVWELYGATSWGNNNCQVNITPMGFVDVSEIIGWISSIAGSECPRNYLNDYVSALVP